MKDVTHYDRIFKPVLKYSMETLIEVIAADIEEAEGEETTRRGKWIQWADSDEICRDIFVVWFPETFWDDDEETVRAVDILEPSFFFEEHWSRRGADTPGRLFFEDIVKRIKR